jgi:hypothetical protein
MLTCLFLRYVVLKTISIMPMRNELLFIVILSSFACSCQNEYELEFEFSPGVTVNCILDSDSILKVKISRTERIGHTGGFMPVTNALVEIIEGNTIQTLTESRDGVYSNSYLPNSGKTYHLKAEIPGYNTISAKTTIPSIPVATVAHNHGDSTYTITLTKNPVEKNYFWIYAQSGYYMGVFMAPPIKVFDNSHSIFTNSVIADDFNREKDNLSLSMDYSHSYGMRIPGENIPDGMVSFGIKLYGRRNLERILIVSVDEHLDKYLKTGLLQRDQKAGGDTPVFLIPISMYTNIENGKGIFGSCSVISFEFDFSHDQGD